MARCDLTYLIGVRIIFVILEVIMKIRFCLMAVVGLAFLSTVFASVTNVYYVDPVNNPNIVAIVAAAAPSSTVYVARGKYTITSTIAPPNGVRIIGETGNFNDVVIDGQNKCRVITANKGNAYIANITITGGKVTGSSSSRTYGAGLYLTAGGVVTNCRITACSSGNYVSGVGLFLQNSYAYDSLIDSCVNSPSSETTAAHRTKGFAVTLNQASVMERCRVINNRMTYGRPDSNYWGGALAIANNEKEEYSNSCIVRNCEISNNVYENYTRNATGTTFGGIGVSVSAGIIENCTVVSNVVLNTTDDSTVGAYGAVCYHSKNGTIRNCHIVDNLYVGTAQNHSTVSTHGGHKNYRNRFVYCVTYPANDYLASSTIIAKDSKYRFACSGKIKLERDSPCVNAGLMQSWMTGAKDLYGKDRVRYGKVDIGAVEWMPSGFTLMLK